MVCCERVPVTLIICKIKWTNDPIIDAQGKNSQKAQGIPRRSNCKICIGWLIDLSRITLQWATLLAEAFPLCFSALYCEQPKPRREWQYNAEKHKGQASASRVQWTNIKTWGLGKRGQFHTNHFIKGMRERSIVNNFCKLLLIDESISDQFSLDFPFIA